MFGIAHQLRSTKELFYNSEAPTLGYDLICGKIMDAARNKTKCLAPEC